MTPATLKEHTWCAFVDHYLSRRHGWIATAALFLVLLVVAASSSAVYVDNRGEKRSWRVRVSTGSFEGSKPDFVKEASTFLAWHWTGPLKPLELGLKLDGLPARMVRIRPFRRTPVVVPDDLLRAPIVLLVPSPFVHGIAGKKESRYRLEVVVNRDTPVTLEGHYRGEPVWLGCEEDVEIPDKLWEKEGLSKQQLSEHPRAFGSALKIEVGDEIKVRVRKPDWDFFVDEDSFSVKRTATGDFPQRYIFYAIR